MTDGGPGLFADNSINLNQKIEAFLIWSEFKACAFAWVFLFVCLPATNPAQFNSRWPIWVATLRTNRLSVLVINPATNSAQFNSPWPIWVATRSPIMSQNLLPVFSSNPAINPDVNSAVVCRPAQLLPSTLMSVFFAINPAVNPSVSFLPPPALAATRTLILKTKPVSSPAASLAY